MFYFATLYCSIQSKVRVLLFPSKVRYQGATLSQNWYVNGANTDNAIRWWLQQSQETGTLLHRRGEATRNNSQEVLSGSPQESTRRVSVQLGIPQTAVWRTVHNRLLFPAYRVQTVPAFQPGNRARRFQFSKGILSNVEADATYIPRWTFSDEALRISESKST